MFKTVTRDIVTTSVSGQQTTEAQSLDFGRTMTIYGNGDPATYGKWEALSADKFASKNITPVDGYTSYYKIGNDGQKVYASAVPSASALDKDGNPVAGTTVYVGYDKSNTDQVVADYGTTLANLHKTTDDNTNIDVNNSRFNTIKLQYDWDHTSGNGNYRKTTVYKLNADGTKFVNTTDPTDSFDASAFKYEWRKGPNTKFGTGTDTGTVLGRINDHRYNTEENYSMKYTVTDPSAAEKLHVKPNYSSFIRVYFNFWGAIPGQTLTFKQNQDISNLNQDQYRQLINVTDLGAKGWNGTNVDPSTQQAAAYTPGTDAYTPGTDSNKTFSMAWAPNGKPSTATVADGVKGTVRINFNDGTYLDVPATINVVQNNSDNNTNPGAGGDLGVLRRQGHLRRGGGHLRQLPGQGRQARLRLLGRRGLRPLPRLRQGRPGGRPPLPGADPPAAGRGP